MLSKTMKTRKIGNTYLVYGFFFFLKNIKILNLKNKEEFADNTFFVFFVFSKTVVKSSFQTQEPNRPI